MAEKHLRADDAPDVEVTRGDQADINAFGRLTNHLSELEHKLTEKEQEVVNLNEAVEEIEMLLDDGACKIKVGETFAPVENDDAAERVEALKEQAEKDLAAMQKKKEAMLADMNKLKAKLYAKFGKSINLDMSE